MWSWFVGLLFALHGGCTRWRVVLILFVAQWRRATRDSYSWPWTDYDHPTPIEYLRDQSSCGCCSPQSRRHHSDRCPSRSRCAGSRRPDRDKHIHTDNMPLWWWARWTKTGVGGGWSKCAANYRSSDEWVCVCVAIDYDPTMNIGRKIWNNREMNECVIDPAYWNSTRIMFVFITEFNIYKLQSTYYLIYLLLTNVEPINTDALRR